jgi:beta-lactamase class A
MARLWRGQGLERDSRDVLFGILERVETGPDRLKGALPRGTTVAHKTGSAGPLSADAGVITLPAGAGHVAIAAWVEDGSVSDPERAQVIAHLARAVHDYFLFARVTPGPAGARR